MAMNKFQDIRCISCGSDSLLPTAGEEPGFRCSECGADYDSVWGVPFFGGFEAEDILGLIEISANIGNRGKFGVNPQVVEDWERLLAAYDKAEDKELFKRSNPEAQSPYLANRYGEWVEITALTKNLPLQGKKVLDIGAGLGFDSHRLTMLGADVTALEFSPILAESGKINFPDIRWVGGFSHCLPFKNASFDAVFCNAALHHMRDIPAAISEALRVLRVGGTFISTCDSFRPSNAGDEFELSNFDADPTVLMGVNEGIPRFSDFIRVPQSHPGHVGVEIFTHTLHNGPFKETLTELTPWDFSKDSKMLSKLSGSLALRLKLLKPWTDPANIQHDAVLEAKDYAQSLGLEAKAMARLAPLMPSQYIDLPFPGSNGSKFELLNGWRLTRPFHYSRTAYRRGRWFLSKPEGKDRLTFDLRLPASSKAADSQIIVLLNGEKAGHYQIGRDHWTRAELDLSGVETGQVFAVEIRFQTDLTGLDEASFAVRNRQFLSAKQYAALNTGTNEHPPVYAVIPVFNRIHYTLECICLLQAQTYPNLHIIVADGGSTDGTVETVREKFPNAAVLQGETELWWAGSMAMGIDHALEKAQDQEGYLLMMNNDTRIPSDYVSSLVDTSKAYQAAVGALIVDSQEPSRILDAGEYINWGSYSFPVRNEINEDEQFRDDVDVLPGRGSLIPLEMIRTAGNVDAERWPHYLADYEFFYRLKRQGYRLGVTYQTRLLAHIEETGIVPSSTITDFGTIFSELFSRRSMTNVMDHWHFVSRHAPARRRARIKLYLIVRSFGILLLRSPLRPAALPFIWIYRSLRYILVGFYKLPRQSIEFLRAAKRQGIDVLCYPSRIPDLVYPPVYLLFCPGPFRETDLSRMGLVSKDLLQQGILKKFATDWYGMQTLRFRASPQAGSLRRLFWAVWNPWRKTLNTLAMLKDRRQ